MIDRAEFVSQCISEWIDKDLTLDQMIKVSGLLADIFEKMDADGADIKEFMTKTAAGPVVAAAPAATGFMDAGLSAIPELLSAAGLSSIPGRLGGAAIDVGTSAAKSLAGYAPLLLLGAPVAAYGLGNYVGRMGASNMDESSTAIKSLKNREILQALRDETARINARRNGNVEQETGPRINFS